MHIGNTLLESEPRDSHVQGRHSNPGLYIEPPNIIFVKMKFLVSLDQRMNLDGTFSDHSKKQIHISGRLLNWV